VSSANCFDIGIAFFEELGSTSSNYNWNREDAKSAKPREGKLLKRTTDPRRTSHRSGADDSFPRSFASFAPLRFQ
jgi:hypothetical protein